MRKEHSGAALRVGPNYVGEAAQSMAGAGEQTTEGHPGAGGYGLGRLHCEALLAQVDSDGGECPGFKFEIDESLDAAANGGAPVFFC
jgi:hypothetical protein